VAAQPATLSDGCMAWGVPSPRRGERSTGKKGGAGVNTKFSYVNASNSGSDARQAARLTADVVTPRKRATGTPAYARFRTAEPPVDSGVGARGSQRACAGRPGDRPPARPRTPRSPTRARPVEAGVGKCGVCRGFSRRRRSAAVRRTRRNPGCVHLLRSASRPAAGRGIRPKCPRSGGAHLPGTRCGGPGPPLPSQRHGIRIARAVPKARTG